MKAFVVILFVGIFVVLNRATPAHRKRDIGLKLREQAKLLRENAEDSTVVYGNNIPGNEAEIISQEFNKDDNGNYNFKFVC